MANTLTVNKVTYTAKPFTFGLFRELENKGVNMTKIDSQSFTLMSGYLAICAGIELEEADKLIEAHLINGGTFEDILTPMTKEMDASDFFHSLSRSKQENEAQNITESEAQMSKRGRKPKEQLDITEP